MKIILTDGTELQVIMVTGGSKYIQNANRDCLSFVFDDTVILDEIDSLFTESNCESIIIVGNDLSEIVYKGYTIRAELKKAAVVVEPEQPESEELTVNRVTVSMAQRTYVENKLVTLSDEVTNTQLALCELYEGGLV